MSPQQIVREVYQPAIQRMLTSILSPRQNADLQVKQVRILARAELAVVNIHVKHAIEWARLSGGNPITAVKEYTEAADLPKYIAQQVQNLAIVRMVEGADEGSN